RDGALVVSKVSDETDWSGIKSRLLASVGMGGVPVIRIVDADHGGDRTLLLRHEFDGRELLLDYAEKTLRFGPHLWGYDVVLNTTIDGNNVSLSWDGAEPR